MKVREIIVQLQNLNPELEVLVSGYRGGYKYVTQIEEPKLFVFNYYRGGTTAFMGPHEVSDLVERKPETPNEYETFEATVFT
jgi:hypothetical protein